MNTAADIIEALNSRAAPTARLRQAARESWLAWLDRGAGRARVTGAPAAVVVAQLAAREPGLPPARAGTLNRWQAFATLWRQNWQPASRDERWWRWTAGGVSFGWHVLIVVLLLVVTALRVIPPTPVEEEIIQVEYLGEGTPAEEGGGPAPSPAATEATESPAAAAGATGAEQPVQAKPASVATQSAGPTESATQVEAAATAPQPLVTTTPVSPEPPVFTVPPTTLPSPRVETVRADVPELQVVEIPQRADAPRIATTLPRVDVPAVPAASPTLVEREVAQVPTAPRMDARVDARVDAPRTTAQSVELQAREVPARAAAVPSASPAPANSATPARTPSRAATNAGPATARPSAGVGTGPAAKPAPGSWATPRRADDWGESTRDRPGNSVFDGDGRPRLADGPGSASAGHPPGMITQEIKDIDRAGTWLRRKPYPYEPTRWDRFWRPNQTMLDEWVDRGVKQVGIPIPGTNKRIICVISILQLGGGCGVSDPNLNDQPATARPPPDVPFKPELQEGNGATWDKNGKPPASPPLPGLFAPPKTGVPPGAARATEAGD